MRKEQQLKTSLRKFFALQQLADTVNGNNPKKLVLNGICYKRI